MAASAHEGQMRKDGPPYIIHPFAVALMLARHGFKEEVIAAALVHDVLHVFEPVPQLDAIIRERIVAGRDHHAQVRAKLLGQHRHRGRRHRPDLDHVHADRGETGDHRRFHHIT